MTNDELDGLAKKTLDAAYRVHTTFGPGLLEKAYAACLVCELRKVGLQVQTEVAIPVVWDGVQLAAIGYRIDVLVENELIIEVKSREAILPVHLSQLITYLKLSDRRLGLLINFNVPSLRDGIYRRVYRF